MKKKFLTFSEVRNLFFETFPQYKSERRARKSQNEYSCNCRCDFVDFVDFLMKDGKISERTADNISLG